MNEEKTIKNMEVYIKELLVINEDINKQLMKANEKLEKIEEYCEEDINYTSEATIKDILEIIKGSDIK